MANPFSIAFIEPHLRCVGGIRRIIEIANRLKALGNDVGIYTPFGKPCTWMPCTVPVYHMPNIAKRKFDFVVFNLAEQYNVASSCKAAYKIFWVLAPEALYKPPEVPIKALKKDFYFLANSKFTVKYIRKYRKVDYEIPIINGGINTEHFRYAPEIPKKYNVLYYGSTRPWKGTKLIEGVIAPMHLRACKMEGLGTPQDQMYGLYNASDVTIVANQCEGFSFVELESMACGTPVLCTDCGGNMDYVIPGVNALVVPRNLNHLRQGLRKLIDNKHLRHSLKVNGLKTARDARFNWDNIAKKFEGAIKGFSNRGQ